MIHEKKIYMKTKNKPMKRVVETTRAMWDKLIEQVDIRDLEPVKSVYLLKPTKKYWLSFTAGGPTENYVGPAIFVRLDPPAYPPGTLEFLTLDNQGQFSVDGFFALEDVRQFPN